MPHTLETLYITQTDLSALLPAAFVVEALDDDGDGVVDAAEAVLIAACNEVDSYLENRYIVPAPVVAAPATIITAAVHFAINLCYSRRGKSEKNPYKTQLKAIRDIMERVRAGKEDLDLTTRGPAESDPIQTLTMEAPAVSDRHRVVF